MSTKSGEESKKLTGEAYCKHVKKEEKLAEERALKLKGKYILLRALRRAAEAAAAPKDLTDLLAAAPKDLSNIVGAIVRMYNSIFLTNFTIENLVSIGDDSISYLREVLNEADKGKIPPVLEQARREAIKYGGLVAFFDVLKASRENMVAARTAAEIDGFVEATTLTRAQAESYLQAAGGDINKAVSMYYEGFRFKMRKKSRKKSRRRISKKRKTRKTSRKSSRKKTKKKKSRKRQFKMTKKKKSSRKKKSRRKLKKSRRKSIKKKKKNRR